MGARLKDLDKDSKVVGSKGFEVNAMVGEGVGDGEMSILVKCQFEGCLGTQVADFSVSRKGPQGSP